MVEWVRLSSKVDVLQVLRLKVGGASSEAFTSMKTDGVVPTDRGEVLFKGRHWLKFELKGPCWGTRGHLLECIISD